MTIRRLLLAGIAAGALWAAPSSGAQVVDPIVDCAGPAGEASRGTAAWEQREAENVYCATQRNLDLSTNPAYHEALATQPDPSRRLVAMDPFREPLRWHGSRFRFDELSFNDADGKELPAMLFRPCDSSCAGVPAGLERHEPPYPAVVIMHGGAANQEMYLWASEGLAEAGYMVLSVNLDDRTDGGHYEATRAGLDWLLSTPAAPSVDGTHNPHWDELDRARIGLAGHSAGGVAVSRIGQEDPRVSAIVSWDRAQSGPMPDDLGIRTPALFLTADFNCQRVPVCLPERYPDADPLGPGNKDEDFRRLRAAGVDAMKVSLRAATHLDFTEWNPLNASRYGAVTSLYFTLAWFDRYLAGKRPEGSGVAADATRRLIAGRFDDSADVHNISAGRWEPATQSNVPAQIAGQPVADRLSFHFRSAYWLEGGALSCESIREGCTTAAQGSEPPTSVGQPTSAPKRRKCKSKKGKRSAEASKRRCKKKSRGA